MRKIGIWQWAAALTMAALGVFITTHTARADAVVGNGTPESCTETAFSNAWDAKGKITFNCGPATTIISLTQNYVVNAPVWLDGAGLVEFRGGAQNSRFNVYNAFTVTRMTFSNFFGDLIWGSVIEVQQGSALIEDVTFANNRISRGAGGAIYNGAPAVMRRVVFLNNRADYGGGAISNGPNGRLEVEQARFENNAAYAGGGLYNNGGVVTVSQSLFAGNVVTEAGGAVANDDNYGSATKFGQFQIINSTLSANSARVGGGVAVRHAGSAITITNSTLNANISTGGYGATLATINGADVRVKNTILSGGSGADNCLSDFLLASLGNNISSDGSCVGNELPDRNNTNPQLEALADNGGFSRTYFPSASSPAIDNGANMGCPATDQRGILRPYGPACDIGAVEAIRLNQKIYLPLMRR